MPRFVVLRHETPPGYARGDHYDLMLERGSGLWTWACEALPQAGQAIVAERLPDHRLVYLDYQGEISASRGRVSRVDAGSYDLLSEADAELAVELHGQTLHGTLVLAKLPGEGQRWRVVFGLA
jgi:hypothetical protein